MALSCIVSTWSRVCLICSAICEYAVMTREYGQSSALSVMTRKDVSQMTEIAGCFLAYLTQIWILPEQRPPKNKITQ